MALRQRRLLVLEVGTRVDKLAVGFRGHVAGGGERDSAIWSALLAQHDAAPPRKAFGPRRPIAIVVGPSCESACELVARVLETYAGAVVIGGVSTSGRLARDEPAMFVLPHSQTSVYFHATRYLLSAEIEAATGPTEEWHALGGDGPDFAPNTKTPYPVIDHMTFATRDVAQRIAKPSGWPRCDSFPVAVPVTDSAKLNGIGQLTGGLCPAGFQITLQSEAPASVLRRFLSTCTAPVQISSLVPGLYALRMPATLTTAQLSQIAASELVSLVTVDCQPEYHIN